MRELWNSAPNQDKIRSPSPHPRKYGNAKSFITASLNEQILCHRHCLLEGIEEKQPSNEDENDGGGPRGEVSDRPKYFRMQWGWRPPQSGGADTLRLHH